MALTPYCTNEQYTSRYGSVANPTQLTECLLDATRLLDSELAARGVEPSDIDADLLMQACRQMANRVVPADAKTPIPSGTSSVSRTVGPYTYQFGFSTPFGSPRVTADELRLLGIGGEPAGWIALTDGE